MRLRVVKSSLCERYGMPSFKQLILPPAAHRKTGLIMQKYCQLSFSKSLSKADAITRMHVRLLLDSKAAT